MEREGTFAGTNFSLRKCIKQHIFSFVFFLRALLHCLLLKVSGSMSDFWESLHDDLSREESPPPIFLSIPLSAGRSF